MVVGNDAHVEVGAKNLADPMKLLVSGRRWEAGGEPGGRWCRLLESGAPHILTDMRLEPAGD
jgi:hypothetical protein